MGLIIILPLALICLRGIIAVHQWLRRPEFGPQWVRNYWRYLTAGILLGICLGAVVRYQLPILKMRGFPFPIEMSNRPKSDAEWNEAHFPKYIQAASFVADVLAGTMLALLPLCIAAFLNRHQAKQADAAKTAPAHVPKPPEA